MGLFVKEKKEKEPQYGRSATNIVTYNYKVYYMKPHEKVMYFLLAFVIGAAVGYLFYGGIGKDEYGDPTTLTWILDISISTAVGLFAGFMYLPIRTKQIRKKKQNTLKLQFRELLDALSTSIGSGKNVVDSFKAARDNLIVVYAEDAPIIKELDVILHGLNNNVEIEKSLLDFGARSGIDDIVSFANVFDTCYRKGGNFKDVITNTQRIIFEKMEVEMEIETIVTGSKNEQVIMTFMPIVLVAVIKLMSPEFSANYTTLTGILSTTVAVVMFIVSYFIGNRILAIKI